jgi:hypothetical protein
VAACTVPFANADSYTHANINANSYIYSDCNSNGNINTNSDPYGGGYGYAYNNSDIYAYANANADMQPGGADLQLHGHDRLISGWHHQPGHQLRRLLSRSPIPIPRQDL